MPLLQEVTADRDHWLGSYGSLVVLFWLREVVPKVCRDLPAIAQDITRRERESKVSVLTIVTPNSGRPGREARSALAELSRESAASVARVAVVREGRGFVASAVASVAMGIHMLAGAPVAHRTFSNLAEGLRWAAEPLRQFRVGRCSLDDVQELVLRKHRFFIERA